MGRAAECKEWRGVLASVVRQATSQEVNPLQAFTCSRFYSLPMERGQQAKEVSNFPRDPLAPPLPKEGNTPNRLDALGLGTHGDYPRLYKRIQVEETKNGWHGHDKETVPGLEGTEGGENGGQWVIL